MATLEVKDLKGKAVGKVSLPKIVVEAEPAMSVLHRAVVSEEANSRQGTQKTKTRSEVRGGGRKPYKQKKTGNARQGTIRAPHYAHGGMALAITPRDYSKKMNKKERRAAILGAFNAQVAAGNVLVAEKILFTEAKTKSATELLKSVGAESTRRVLVILPAYDDLTYRSFRNIPGVEVRTAPVKTVVAEPEADNEEAPKAKAKKKVEAAPAKSVAFSTRDLLVAHKIVIAQDALKAMEEVWA